MFKSWRTSLFGSGGLLIIAANTASLIFDGDPSTNVDWGVTIPAIMLACSALFARDNAVTSKEAGAEK